MMKRIKYIILFINLLTLMNSLVNFIICKNIVNQYYSNTYSMTFKIYDFNSKFWKVLFVKILLYFQSHLNFLIKIIHFSVDNSLYYLFFIKYKTLSALGVITFWQIKLLNSCSFSIKMNLEETFNKQKTHHKETFILRLLRSTRVENLGLCKCVYGE